MTSTPAERSEKHDRFDQLLAAIPACTLDRSEAQTQKERYRAIAPFITNVREEAMTVVVEFGDDVRRAAVEEAIAVERQCCVRGLDFEFDRRACSLRVTATDPADTQTLELVAAEFRKRLA